MSEKTEAIERIIQDAAGREIIHGEHDCCIFVAKVVEVATGKNPMKLHKIEYRDLREAKSILGENPISYIANLLHEMGLNVINPRKCRFGDIVALCKEGLPMGFAMGVVNGPGTATFLSESGGVRFIPIEETTSAWEVSSCLE